MQTLGMGQPEDALLDLIGRIRKSAASLCSASEDGEWGKKEQDLMAAKADGLMAAVTLAEIQLAESRGEKRRVY